MTVYMTAYDVPISEREKERRAIANEGAKNILEYLKGSLTDGGPDYLLLDRPTWMELCAALDVTTPQGDGHISPAQAEGKEPPEPRGYLVAQCV